MTEQQVVCETALSDILLTLCNELDTVLIQQIAVRKKKTT